MGIVTLNLHGLFAADFVTVFEDHDIASRAGELSDEILQGLPDEAIAHFTRGVVVAILGAGLAAGAMVLLSSGAVGVSPGQMAVIIFTSMVIGFLTAALAGSSIPLLLRRFGFDPAMASNIFLTMITDSVGFGVFLATATLLI